MENTIKEIKIQFEEMLHNKIPMFEIASDTIEDEYYTYNINIDKTGIWTRPYNTEEILRVDFEAYKDELDFYLDGLYDACLNDILEYENSLNK